MFQTLKLCGTNAVCFSVYVMLRDSRCAVKRTLVVDVRRYVNRADVCVHLNVVELGVLLQ